MKLIVGLGNPEPEYERTRHNVGFAVVRLLAAQLGIPLRRRKFDAVYGEGACGATAVCLCLPQTFMNRSGVSVGAFCRFFRLDLADLLVVHDDLDLGVGQLKFATNRGAAGHRGVASIVETLGGGGFDRLRLGIGRPDRGADPAEYVLQRFTSGEAPMVEAMLTKGMEAIRHYCEHGVQWAMERYHQKTLGKDAV